jgi:hypothetical protein
VGPTFIHLVSGHSPPVVTWFGRFFSRLLASWEMNGFLAIRTWDRFAAMLAEG